MTVPTSKTLLVNLKGPIGPIGPQGLPGTNAVPADSAVAGYISTTGSSSTKTALEARYRTTVRALANGVVGDGTADDSAALNALMSSSATFGLTAQLEAGSTVRLASVPLALPTGARLDLNRATLKSALPGTNDPMVSVSGATNVAVFNGTLDGDKANFAGTTEWRHNIYIKNSIGVTIRDVRSINAKGDGVYIGDQVAGLSRDVYLENSVFDQNHRNGMSVTHASGVLAVGCVFSNTSGTNPQAGVDIEPNTADIVCENIRFVGCKFKDNAHFGFLVAVQTNPTVQQGDIYLDGCSITGNGAANDGGGGGIRLVGAATFTMVGGKIRSNTGHGVLSDTTYVSSNVKFAHVTIERNTGHGIGAPSQFVGFTLTGCTIRDNSSLSANSFDGVNIAPAAASTGVKLSGNTISGANHRYGITIGANVSGLILSGNDVTGAVTNLYNLLDDPSTRVQLDGAVNSLPRTLFYGATGSSSPVVSVRQAADTTDRVNILADGRITFSSGSAGQDAILSRPAAGVLGVNVPFRHAVYTTAGRPSASTAGAGAEIFDSTLGIPLWSNGSAWRDATGTAR